MEKARKILLSGLLTLVFLLGPLGPYPAGAEEKPDLNELLKLVFPKLTDPQTVMKPKEDAGEDEEGAIIVPPGLGRSGAAGSGPASPSTGGEGSKNQSGPAGPVAPKIQNANEYLALPPYDREVYVNGISDSYRWVAHSGFARLKWLNECLAEMPVSQQQALFEKWLEEKPGRWQEPTAKLFAFALYDFCRKKPEENG